MFLTVLITEISKSFADPAYWLGNLGFLAAFITVIALAGWPLLALVKDNPLRLFLWPVLGMVNFLILLLLWQNVVYFTNWSSGYLLPFILAIFVLECVFIHRSYPLTRKLVHPSREFVLVSILYLGLFLIISARHFDPENHTFFVPGYELNHDAIGIAASVKMLAENIPPTNSLATYMGSLGQYFNYPVGGADFQLFFTKLLNTDVYFIYSRVILASFLIALFVLAYWLLSQKLISPLPLTFLCILLVLNYLTVNFLNTSVLASTVVIPLILLSWVLLYEQKHPLLLVLTLTAGVFLYIYIINFYLVLFLIGLYISGVKITLRHAFLVLLLVSLSFCNPHNLLTTTNYVRHQFTSANKEMNLFHGMSGNLGNYLSPFQTMSLWFSNPIYIVQAMRTGNTWIAAAALMLLIAILAFFKPAAPHPHRLRWLFLFAFPCSVILCLTFLTRSPYQNAKVMQMIAPLWPVLVYLLVLPYLHHRMVKVLSLALALLSISSGLYAMVYVGKPVIASNLEFKNMESRLCRDPQTPLLLIGRDEWSKYFLMRCQNIYYYLDRSMSWSRVVETNQLNGLTFVSQPCADQSLSMPTSFTFTDPHVLVDRCFIFNRPDYQKITETDRYVYYQKP